MTNKKRVFLWVVATQLWIPAAFAQQPPGADGDLDEVVVTGVRESLDQARDLKRNQIQFVDAIVASDIGKLPDTNVAESLARVSGVQIDRGIGEGTDITIRGQHENVILFNGRQIFDSTGRGGNGLDQLNTSTYGLLSLVPSELISRLEVTKLSGADQIEGGLGGVVDIVTRKPLDVHGPQFAVSGTASYDDLPGKGGYEFFGLASNTFADDTFGILVSAVAGKRDLAEQGVNTFSGWGVIADNDAPLFDANGNPVSNDPNGDGKSGLFDLDARLQQIAETRERVGLTALAQWRPSENFELTLDGFYSRLDSDRDRYWIGYFAGFGPHTDVVFSPHENLLAGIVTRPINTNAEFADTESDIKSTALTADWSVSESWKIHGAVDYSDSTSSYAQRFFRLQSNAGVPISYDLRVGDFGSFTFPTDLTDPSGLNLAILYDNLFASESKNKSVSGDSTWTFDSSWLKSVEVGARYNEIDTDTLQRLRDIEPGTPATDLSAFTTVFSNPDFLPGGAPGLPRSYLTGSKSVFENCESFAEIWNADQQAICETTVTPLGSFQIEEKFTAAYAKLDFEGSLGDHKLAGNVGVRFLHRDLTSTGSLVSNGGVIPNVFERTDDDVLPSAVVRYDASDSVVLRFGAARVVAYPNTEALNNGLQDFDDGTAVGGSPDLDPFRANQFDASAEWYFAPGSLLSLGLFYKDIDTFIVQSAQQEDLPGHSTPVTVVRQINGEAAKVKGVEVLYQQPFTFLPAPFDGFGVVATYSFIDSNTPVEDRNGNALTLPGLSKNNVNLVAYYEKGPASIRLAYNWRDRYLQGIGPSDTGVFFDEYKDFAATARWEFSKSLSVTLEGINLLDSQLRTYNAFPEALRTNTEYGRIFKFTVAARF
ncbi:MAG: TonB-dependent receptor [Pseudomonadota bacterium]